MVTEVKIGLICKNKLRHYKIGISAMIHNFYKNGELKLKASSILNPFNKNSPKKGLFIKRFKKYFCLFIYTKNPL